MFQVNEQNLQHVKDVIEQFGECWIHGCGNVYLTKKDSEFRRKYSNPLHNGQASAPKYYAHFTSVAQVPDTVEELIRLFENNHTNDIRKAAENETRNNPTTKVVKSTKRTETLGNTSAAYNADDLIKTAAHLQEKHEEITTREDVLEQQSILLEEKQQELYAKEQEQAEKATKFNEAAEKKHKELLALQKSLEEKEAALAEKELVAKAGKKNQSNP